jgi:hypothetical protein
MLTLWQRAAMLRLRMQMRVRMTAARCPVLPAGADGDGHTTLKIPARHTGHWSLTIFPSASSRCKCSYTVDVEDFPTAAQRSRMLAPGRSAKTRTMAFRVCSP